MEGLHLFSLATLNLMWLEMRRDIENPLHEVTEMERAIENEYFARTGKDIRNYGK